MNCECDKHEKESNEVSNEEKTKVLTYLFNLEYEVRHSVDSTPRENGYDKEVQNAIEKMFPDNVRLQAFEESEATKAEKNHESIQTLNERR